MQQEVDPLLGQKTWILMDEMEYFENLQGVFNVLQVAFVLLIGLIGVLGWQYLELVLDQFLHEHVD